MGPDPDPDPELASDSLLGNKSCCLCFPCFGTRRSNTVGSSWWEKIRTAKIQSSHDRDEPRWWVRAGLKIREWSEIVAGPRWKTFIRRFKYFNQTRGRGRGQGGGEWLGKFQYDPLSYALNFDEGQGQNGDFNGDDDDDVGFGGFRSFSTRYASVPLGSAKVPAASAAVTVSSTNRTLVDLGG